MGKIVGTQTAGVASHGVSWIGVFMRSKCILTLLLFVPSMLFGQTVPSPTDQSTPTFRSKVPVVLVDVVVTDNHGKPISGLKQTDFQMVEDGKSQTIASLEEHKGEPPAHAEARRAAGEFTNSPSGVFADSVNVLLIDGLNTSVQDQAFVHGQILKFLKSIPLGAQMAVFTLTTRLRMLQGFTTDSSALLTAVNSKAVNAPYASPLLQSEAEQQSHQQTINFMEANRGGPPPDPDDLTANSVDPIAVLQQMFAETTVRLTEARVRITLQAMQALGRYLAAFPGRKNVMWVSGTFPIMFLPDSELPNPFFSLAGFQDDIQRTADLLTGARVAIYPIAAQGLMGNTAYQANAMEVSETRPSNPSQNQSGQLQKDVAQGQLMRESMEELAKNTGGQAFYDTNGIGDALTRVTNNSANFYTLSYTPTNRQMDGKYRHISVKLATGKGKLSYRRGYFALREEDATRTHETDPLVPLMAFGLPDISQIVYKARIAAVKSTGGDQKTEATVPAKGPDTTYTFDLEILPDQLQFEVTPDGVRHGKIELKLVAYDDSGKAINIVGGSFGLNFKPDRFEKMRQAGFGLREQIAVPGNVEVHFYSGICDLNSGRIGTLAVQVHGRTAPTASK